MPKPKEEPPPEEEAEEVEPPPPPPPGPDDTLREEGAAWRYLTVNQQKAYFAAPREDAAARAAILADALGLPEYRFDARSSILVDYAMYALDSAASLGLPAIKVSSIFTSCQKLVEALQRGESLADCQATVKDCFVTLASPSPKIDDESLGVVDIARMGAFLADTVLAHHRLYVHVFASQQPQLERKTVLEVETSEFMPSLKAARSEEDWNAWQVQLAEEAEAKAKAEAEAKAAAEAEAAAAAEAERKAAEEAARKAELELKPATLEEAIAKALAVRLEAEREKLAKEYKEKEAILLDRIAKLEGGKGSTPKGK